MLLNLDAPSVRRWCADALRALTACQREIDELNVYPVADHDTGANLVLTLRAAADEVEAGRSAGAGRFGPAGPAGPVLRAMARGAAIGAHGNSGVIVAQFLRGLADELDTVDRVDGAALAGAFRRGELLAWQAVDDPVEGTALSVLRAAADAARDVATPGPNAPGRGACGQDDSIDHAAVPAPADLAGVTCAAATAAAVALRRTPRQLAPLARAGLVDAGGRGVVVLLDALAEVVAGRPAPVHLPPTGPPAGAPGDSPAVDRLDEQVPAAGRVDQYEVQYLLDATEDDVLALRSRLSVLGGSVAVVGAGDGTWNVHAHVADAGAAIEAGVEVGRPWRIRVTCLVGHETGAGRRHGNHVAVVAVAPGEGLSGLFEAEGVVVVDGGPGRAPSADEVCRAIQGTGADAVIVLPNHGEVTAIADRAARQARAAGQQVAVVPTRSVVQGLAAVAVHDLTRRFDDDVVAMAEAAAATRWAEVVVADGEALTMAGRCQAGDVLGMADGDVVLIRQSVPDATVELVDRMLLAGGELVTVVLGADVEPDLGPAIERHVAARYPAVEVRVYDGGQPGRPVILGVE